MSQSPEMPLSEAMNRLWAKYLPQLEERVATLRNAAASLAQGNLSVAEQQQASADAHKLAGVLGTFGLKAGTELAREAEVLYSGNLESTPETTGRLSTIAEELRAMLASRG